MFTKSPQFCCTVLNGGDGSDIWEKFSNGPFDIKRPFLCWFMLPKGLQNDPLWVKRAASLRGFGHLGHSSRSRSRLGGGYKACTTSGGQTGCDTEAGPETPFQPNLAQKVQPNSFQLWNKTCEKYKGHFDIKSNQFLDTFWKWIWAKLLELLVAEELSPNLP